MGAVNGTLVAGLGLPSIVVTLATLVIGRESLRYLREGRVRPRPAAGLPVVRRRAVGRPVAGRGDRAGGLRRVRLGPAVPRGRAGRLRDRLGPRGRPAGRHPAAARRLRRLRRHGRPGRPGRPAQRRPASRRRPQRRHGLELQVIAAVVVGGVAISGGRGTLAGTLIGVALLGSIGPALVFLGTKPQWEKAIQGLIILLAVASDAFYREGR